MKMDAVIETQTDYCAYCPKLCRFSCPVAEAETRETVTPWGLMSLLRAVRREEIPLNVEVGEVFFHCTGCMRCQTFCKHEHDVPLAMFAARRLMVDAGMGVPPALRGLELLTDNHGSYLGAAPVLSDEVSEVFDASSPVAWLPGAERRVRNPESVLRIGRLLARVLGRKVALFEGDEAQVMMDSGDALRQAGYGAAAETWREALIEKTKGFKRLVTEDATWLVDGGAENVVHLLEFLAEGALPGRLSVPEWSTKRVFLHDAGRVVRVEGQGDATKSVLTALLGREPEQFWQHGAEAWGSGAGAHYESVDPEGAAQAARNFLTSALEQGAEVVVTASVCGARLLRAEAAQMGGLEVHELVDIMSQFVLEDGVQ